MQSDAGVTRPAIEADALYSPSVYGASDGLPGATAPVLAEAVEDFHRRLQLVEERGGFHIQPDANTACVA
ncbi:hypothetical protein QCN29_15235 [Streptomyces sp. HNM0663]|uniref:Uncharacterized protein n=1 Tax=Streptomyces chengmaiensis TaxID=3040919 RepID=A0ABT6HP62_9ACTN|nr:hypothetical protein [Streptomyces chengmaiensis]MDH2390121.1 hypothetical protein [Streptomyces chengmaiensis]